MEYSSSVWEPYTKNLINKLESVQRRAARFCPNDFRSKSPGCVTNMIKKLEWESLTDRRQTRRLVIFHKAVHGHLSIPLGKLVTSRSRPPDPHGIPTPELSPHSQQTRIATNIPLCPKQLRTGIVFQTLLLTSQITTSLRKLSEPT